MIRSQLKSPFRGRIPMEQVRPGLYAVRESYTGEYRFFPHSEPTFYIRGTQVGEREYRNHVAEVLLKWFPPKNIDMQTMCAAMCI